MNPQHYEALKAYGFSPGKAAEIELDARRGSAYAQRWLEMACNRRYGLFADDYKVKLDAGMLSATDFTSLWGKATCCRIAMEVITVETLEGAL